MLSCRVIPFSCSAGANYWPREETARLFILMCTRVRLPNYILLTTYIKTARLFILMCTRVRLPSYILLTTYIKTARLFILMCTRVHLPSYILLTA